MERVGNILCSKMEGDRKRRKEGRIHDVTGTLSLPFFSLY